MAEAIIPNPSAHDVVSYEILVEDQALNPSYQLLSLSISTEINRVPVACFSLRDGDASEQQFEISNSDDLVPGKKITIKIGFDSDNTPVFKGIITRHALRVRENGQTEMHIECRDEAVKMTLGRKSKYYTNIKDSDLVNELVDNYKGSITADPAETQLQHKELVQHHVSDWDFLLLRAEASGMLVTVEQGKVRTLKPDTAAEPVLQLTYGSSVIELEAEMDARSQWKNVKASSWNFAGQELFTAETTEANNFTQPGNLSGANLADTVNKKLEHYEMRHSGPLPEQELQNWTDGLMLRSRLAKIRGRAKITGFGGIKPADMVKLDGIGDRFNGNAFVTAIRHEVSQGAWETHIQFGLDPERYASVFKNIEDPLSSGLMPSINGLQIGVVVHLATDPDGEDRILVKLPLIDNHAEGTWCRVACLDAGEERGTFFRPELRDEVIVGFINGDPRHGVVLGQLNSSAKPAPLRASDDNHEKGIFTRSKMRVHFNDNTKTITIDTPAGNSIKLDEQGTQIEIKDQNNNKMTMNPQGVSVESPANVEIKATGTLTLTAGTTLSINAANITAGANGSLNLSGGGSAKLSSSGITEITGSLVKIN